MAARIRSLDLSEELLDDARPDTSVYRTIAETFPGEPFLPRLRRLVYVLPRVDQSLNVELEMLVTPSLSDFSFDTRSGKGGVILERLSWTLPWITALTWKRSSLPIPLPHSLSKISTLRTLNLSELHLNNENISIIAMLSCLVDLRLRLVDDWPPQKSDSVRNMDRILHNLESLDISGRNEDVIWFISRLNSLRCLTAVFMWEALTGSCLWSSIGHVISSLKTLCLTFTASNGPEYPPDIEKLFVPFGHATAITELSIVFCWWTNADTLVGHLANLLENFASLESLNIDFQAAVTQRVHMGSLQVNCNAAKICPKLKRMRFVGNINTAILDGPVTASFAKLEELDFGDSRGRDEFGRPVGVDQGMLKDFIERIAPGFSLGRGD